jgi:histidinol phosphatase-like enzyme
MRPAVFVDRDGVINKLVADPVTGEPESPLRVGEVALLPGAATALRRLAGEGWLLVGISNQPAAAKGLVGLEQLKVWPSTPFTSAGITPPASSPS